MFRCDWGQKVHFCIGQLVSFLIITPHPRTVWLDKYIWVHSYACSTSGDFLQVHLKNTEIENTKLLTEVQTLKNLDANKENLITHYKEELGKTKLCLEEKEKMCKDLLQNCAEKVRAALCGGRTFLYSDDMLYFLFNQYFVLYVA